MGAKEPGSVGVEPVELPPPSEVGREDGPELLSDAVEIVEDTTVLLEARLGEASLSIRQLMELREGSIVELNRDLNEPVDVLLNGKLIARGKLVAHGDQFGVQITEIRAAGQ
jgi:flagellar motor switch protein FliN/FliY